YLNIGDPNKFDFRTPQPLIEALISGIESGARGEYGDAQGLPEFRKSMCLKEKRVSGVSVSPDDVIVTSGISEGIRFLTTALLDPNDELLAPGPVYPPYIGFTTLAEATPTCYATLEDEKWQPDIDDLRNKVTEKTRAILIINPNNPTGGVLSEKHIRAILDVAGEHNLPVVTDEIYDQLILDNITHHAVAKLSKDIPVITLNGLSKAYLIPGWRLGYIYFHDPTNTERLNLIKEAVMKQARIRLCVSTPMQWAAARVFENLETILPHIEETKEKLRRRKQYTVKRIDEIQGLSITPPQAAFYAFPKINDTPFKNDKQFALELLSETGVLVVPGSGFGEDFGKNHFRMVFLPPIDTLTETFDLIEGFLKKVNRN
ncbi:MAG: aminotransferase class I/II-fold pyridoxal phosphate-dependent enzyme, partial [Candidatus Ranarchaeia archaeon]